MSVPKKISPAMVKRFDRYKGHQDKKGVCIICGANFEDCEHSFRDMDTVLTAIETAKLLGLLP